MSGRAENEGSSLLTEREAAELLRLSVATLQAWRVDKEGPPYLKMGRSVRYERAVLLSWARDRAVFPKAKA